MSGIAGSACVWAALVAAAVISPATAGGREPPRDPSSFTRSALLERFDADRSGGLETEEILAARRAFGGIEIPMLPDAPFDYLTVHRPPHVTKSIEELDNTPGGNPTTNPGAALGRVLFHDRQLSKNNTVACASCHLQNLGFADPRPASSGFEGKVTSRNAMGLVNARFTNVQGNRPGFFWDERAPTLEQQVLMPIQDPVEMGMELGELEARLSKLPYYPPLFAAAFGSGEVTSERIARAVAQFLRAMESWDSRFDREAERAEIQSLLAQPFAGFTPLENIGKALFVDGIGGVAEFGCAHCHVPPTFAMAKSLNNGLDLVSTDPGLGGIDRPVNDPFTPSNHGKFKAPSLRNIELTAPYMHDGRFQTLEQVIDHYGHGVRSHENLALAFSDEQDGAEVRGYRFTEEQKAGLIAFLKTLTDRSIVEDPRFSDPFLR